MNSSPVEVYPAPEPERRPGAWIDLILYLGIGIGLFLIGSLVLGSVLQTITLTTSVILYVMNIVVFVGTVLVVGVLRHKLSLREIGFWPPRLSVKWFSWAVILSLLFLPIRAGVSVLAQYLISGNLNSLSQSPRMEIFAPGGFTWPSFLLTLLLAGILVPISEELFFRGALYSWFRSRWSMWVAALLSALLFGLGHADTFVVVISSFILGLLNAVLFERSRTIWAPIVVHMVNNSLAVVALYAMLGLGIS